MLYQTKKCIGCGYCCRKGPCGQPSTEWDNGKCSSLVWVAETRQWRCARVLTANARDRALVTQHLAIGAGCCSPLNTYRRFNYVPAPNELEQESELLTRLNSTERELQKWNPRTR